MTEQLALLPVKPPKLTAYQQDVYDLLRGDGRTDQELAEQLLKRSQGSVAKRRGELVELGLVRDSGRKRPSAFGRDMTVWEVA